jgi:probable phosphoglycerate mutase
MKIIFVRHGDPNYKDDFLTDLGHNQAKAVSERLKNIKIDKIFSSSCGRAFQTAEHVNLYHNLEIVKLDFMREIIWGDPASPDYVMPWTVSNERVLSGVDLFDHDWKTSTEFKGRSLVTKCNFIAENFDNLLKSFGLTREGLYYRIEKECTETILLTSHGGSSSAVLSHIFNLPLPFVCRTICPRHTAVTEVVFNGEQGKLTSPQFEFVNDISHLNSISSQLHYE